MSQCVWQRLNSLNKETFLGIKIDIFINNHLKYTETFGDFKNKSGHKNSRKQYKNNTNLSFSVDSGGGGGEYLHYLQPWSISSMIPFPTVHSRKKCKLYFFYFVTSWINSIMKLMKTLI